MDLKEPEIIGEVWKETKAKKEGSKPSDIIFIISFMARSWKESPK